MPSPALAIDFGTSNSAAAMIDGGGVRRLAIETGADTLPTAVFFPTQGGLKIGAAAAEALVAGIVAGRLERLSVRFAAPLRLDEAITVDVVDRGPAHRVGCRAWRLMFARSTGRVAALMDLTINEGSGSGG